MSLFLSTLNQMGVLGLYMVIGFIIAKLGVVEKSSTKVLSKLENTIFLPALVLYTFIQNFNIATLSQSWQLLLFSLGVELVIIPIAIISAKLASKDGFIRRMYTYGLCFSNFGFMGNAVVQSLFSATFYQSYIIFTLPLWTIIYVWGVPNLLIERDENAPTESRKENFIKKAAPQEIFQMIFNQTLRFEDTENMLKLLDLLDALMSKVDLYTLGVNMDISSAQLSYGVMSGKTEI